MPQTEPPTEEAPPAPAPTEVAIEAMDFFVEEFEDRFEIGFPE